jgi:DNA (cytosine-5)-methyltransferase 1
MIRVVDIFAGPGGLSEGFAATRDKHGNSVFDIVLSIEMDVHAYATLKLRTFFREFPEGAPSEYYKHLRLEIDRNAVYNAHPHAADRAGAKCWHAKLGPGGEPTFRVSDRIKEAIGNHENWVLIGGPPCQAYSIAGRSRNHGNPAYDAKKDIRQRLYVEYLQVLADHRPAIFIMENVKGLLSAKLDSERIFQRILDDLRSPAAALKREGRVPARGRLTNYRIFSLVEPRMFENGDIRGAVVRAEEYGIPQARHRVILLGVSEDLKCMAPPVLGKRPEITTAAVIESLPRLRSGLLGRKDSARAWTESLRSQVHSRWANAGTRCVDPGDLSDLIRKVLGSVEAPIDDRGGEFLAGEVTSGYLKSWFCDPRIGGVCNHITRGHMKKDLYRYLYAACFAKLHGRSPFLRDFPTDLLPDHASVEFALRDGSNFSDRFRVQVADRFSTTIMSHISKDGHYYIHPDPEQCRSLTVREAARLQTFPDNYYFCGPRTEQYVQVGNAVPPLLAKRIGGIVRDVLSQEGVLI